MGNSGNCPERFWLEEPRDLLARFDIFPKSTDTWEQVLNSITRLVIVIAIILAICKWKHWLTFLVVGIILVIFVYLLKRQDSMSNTFEHFNEEYNASNFKYYKPQRSEKPMGYTRHVMPAQPVIVNGNKMQKKGKAKGVITRVVASDGTQKVSKSAQSKQPKEVAQSIQSVESVRAALMEVTPAPSEIEIMHESSPAQVADTKLRKAKGGAVIERKTRRQQKSAYEHAKDAWMNGMTEEEMDEAERDRRNLFGSIL